MPIVTHGYWVWVCTYPGHRKVCCEEPGEFGARIAGELFEKAVASRVNVNDAADIDKAF